MVVFESHPTKNAPGLEASSQTKSQLQWQSWARLMERVQRGDPEAYRQLLDEIGPLLFHFVRKRVFNPELVEDIYQEVLLTFHKARHSYEPSRPLGPWLFAVARHSILTALGKNRKFTEREVPTEVLPDIAPEQNDKGLEDELFQALEALPELNRKAVDLLPWYAPWRWGSRIPEGIPDELRKHGFEVCRQVVYDPATGSVC